MELDHISDDKVIEVSAMKSLSRDKILKEIVKCEPVLGQRAEGIRPRKNDCWSIGQ